MSRMIGARLRWALCLLCLLWGALFSCQGQTVSSMQRVEGHVLASISKGKAARLGVAEGSQHLHLAFQLPLRNQADLKSLLARLYDPGSADYHKYLTVDEFTEKYGPTKEDYQAVVDYVKSHGMTVLATPRNRMLVEVDGTVDKVNEALHVTINKYQHPTEKRTFFAPDREPTVELSTKLQHIAGLEDYSKPFAKLQLKTSSSAVAKSTSSTYPPDPTGSGPYNSYIPSDFRAAYYGDGPLDGTGQTIGLLELDGYDQVDLDNFYANSGFSSTVPINVVLLGGLTAPMSDGGNDAEPILDMVYALSMTPKLSQLRVYQCCGSSYSGSESGPAVILNAIAAENIAKQISCSYGWGAELSVEDPIYQEMAAQGQTFFAATGDYGSPQNPGNNNYDDYFPADDAWVTAVSMSLLSTTGPGGGWSADIYASGAGGGYSDGPTPVPLPSYQAGIATVANQASTTYRNMPDVVIDGYGAYLCGGSDSTGTHQCYPNASCTTCTNGGSSMSAPIWASYMALVNQKAAEEGKSAIGFLNPALYSIGEGANYSKDFHDIIGGSNNCCNQTYAYNAVAGFDLVSGWGTPNGDNLIEDLVNQSSSFSLLLSSNALTIGPGDSTTTTVSVGSASGFSGDVTLSVSGLPSGVTASFDTNPATTTSTLTLSSTASPVAGSYTVTVKGVAGDQSLSTNLALTVTSAQGNFTVGSTLTALALQDGTSNAPSASNANWITVTSVDNFAGDVALSVASLPTGVTASFSPATVTLTAGGTATSSLTLTASNSSPTGAVTAAITGTSGTLANSLPLLLSVTPSFTVGTTSSSFSVAQGDSVAVPVYIVSQNGFSSAVTLSISGVPSGVTASFSPATVTPAANGNVSSTLTLTAASGASVGSSPVVISASTGVATATESATVVVAAPAAAFSITSPSFFALNVVQGGSIAVPIAVTRGQNSFTGAVALTISGLPSGITASFSPASVTPSDSNGSAISTLKVSATSAAVLNSFTQATITGTSGATTATLTLYAGATGVLAGSANNVADGGTIKINYTTASELINGANWIGIVAHGASPQGTALMQQAAASASGSASFNVTNLADGSYDAWLYYDGGTTTLAGPFTFTVGSAPSFALSVMPSIVTMSSGGNSSIAFTLTSQNGFSSAVTFAVSGLPSGVSGVFSPATVTPTANGTVSSVLLLTSSTSSAAVKNKSLNWLPVSALALLLLPMSRRMARQGRRLLTALLLAVGMAGILMGASACSSSSSKTVAPTQVTVTATSGAQSVSTTFTLEIH